jgi:hypothetical protein
MTVRDMRTHGNLSSLPRAGHSPIGAGSVQRSSACLHFSLDGRGTERAPRQRLARCWGERHRLFSATSRTLSSSMSDRLLSRVRPMRVAPPKNRSRELALSLVAMLLSVLSVLLVVQPAHATTSHAERWPASTPTPTASHDPKQATAPAVSPDPLHRYHPTSPMRAQPAQRASTHKGEVADPQRAKPSRTPRVGAG